ncbi:MAG: right-handed parallel beta-helix repeat-containing protein [Planctomycetota bacterium]|jgi:hypothetical protein
MRNLLIITICFAGLVFAGSTNAAVHYVPTDYANIQAAIDATVDGDTVVVTAGTYSGPGNCNINFRAKAITVQSIDPGDPYVVNSTVIDCQDSPSTRGFIFQSGETSESKLAGLKIIGGDNFLGGGIYFYNNSSPTISNCVITDNSAVFGGALAVGNNNSQPRITGCTITANSALVGGGAIYCISSSPTIESCIIAGNNAPRGGAIYSHNAGNPVISNCTIATNAASVFAGGLYCFASSNLDISNSILRANIAPGAPEMMVGNMGAPSVVNISYCNIQGLSAGVLINSGSTVNWGQGNIDLDPMFVEPGQIDSLTMVYTQGDYHLLEDSGCIDAGDPAFVAAAGQTDIDGGARKSGEVVDIGADEFEVITAINAKIKITPKALNLKSRGRWLFCSIDLEGDYKVSDIVVDSITLNDEVKPAKAKSFRFNREKLFVVFDRSEVQSTISDSGKTATLIITGSLEDDTVFQGQKTVKIAGRHRHHHKMKDKICEKLAKFKKHKHGKMCKR